MPSGYVYGVSNGDAGVVITTAITILQVKAGAAALELIRASVTQGLSEANTQEHMQIVRKSAAATVTSFTPRKYNPGDPVSLAVGGTAATGYTASAEGTDGEVIPGPDVGWNILNGWLWVPTEDRIVVLQGGIIALKFPVAPASATYRAAMVFKEYQ